MLKATYVHEYGFARKVTYCVRMSTALRVKQFMCTSSTWALKATYVYEYGFVRKAY